MADETEAPCIIEKGNKNSKLDNSSIEMNLKAYSEPELDNINDSNAQTCLITPCEPESSDSITEPDHAIDKNQPISPDTRLIVGIDIGASMCGFAYSEVHPFHIHLNEPWRNEFGTATSKTPAAVLKPTDDKLPSKSGYEAFIAYKTSLEPDNFKFYDRFKVTKSDKTELIVCGLNESENMTVEQFLEDILTNLNYHIKVQLEKNRLMSCEDYTKIHWIITSRHSETKETITALIIKAAQSSFQLESANNIWVLQEDKAAAIWCQRMPIFEQSKDAKHFGLENETYFGIIDFEGEYLSIFKTLKDKEIKKILSKNFSFDLTIRVTELFEQIFLPKDIAAYRKKHPRDWLVMMHQVQTQLEGFRWGKEDNIHVSLQYTFVKKFEKKKNIQKFVEKCSKNINGIVYDNDSLIISHDHIKTIIEGFSKQIITYLEEFTKKETHLDVLFLIGGAALLEDTLYNKVHSLDGIIVVPHDPNMCALKGAVLFGNDPKKIID